MLLFLHCAMKGREIMSSHILIFTSHITDQPIDLSEAFNHINETPLDLNSTEAFIGFVNEKEEIIQFLRHDENEWTFDIPLQDPKTKQWNKKLLQLHGITTALVKRIVENFFVDTDLIHKINSTYRLEDSIETEAEITYIKIDPGFIQWIEQHRSNEMYS